MSPVSTFLILAAAQAVPGATPAPAPAPVVEPAPAEPAPPTEPPPPAEPARSELPPYHAEYVPPGGVPLDVFPDTPPPPRRSGLTLEGSLGVGVTRLPGGSEAEHFLGLSGLNVGIGGFLGPEMALTLRIAGSTFTTDRFGPEIRTTSGFFGPALQRWVSDRVFVGGGLGFGVYATSGSEVDDIDADAETGLAVDLRIGSDLVSGPSGALHLAVELIPVFLEEGTVASIGLQLGAQLF